MNLETKILYHYTSLDVLKCIFEDYSSSNPNLTFWASNCAFMNDPREISEGIDLIKDALFDIPCPILKERAKVIWDNDNIKDALLISSVLTNIGVPYAISLSAVKDNLNMWRMYGNEGKGIALGLKHNKIIADNCELVECFYNGENSEDFISAIKSGFEFWFSNLKESPIGISQRDYDFIRTLEAISPIVSRVKNSAYRYEKESRLITNCKNPGFRVTNNLLIPYTPIRIPADALESIILGPDCDERNLNSLRLFFISKGLRDISDKLSVSNIPYRN